MNFLVTTIFFIFIVVNNAWAQNAIVTENQLPGTPSSQWDLGGPGSTTLLGFTTDISVNHGSTVEFKIQSDTNDWRIDIYRLGYYQGNGARLITTINKNTAQSQPAPVTNAATGEVDAGNWVVTASWAVPSTAVSGVYIAHLVDNTNANNESHIPFIVRADESTSDIAFQTSDTTWQAYNGWGGANLYGGNGPGGDTAVGRAYKVSYNRPIATRDAVGRAANWTDYLFGAEYAAIYWLEQNGYDVSYIAGVDVARAPALLTQHKAFTSTGHDEYWDTAARANVEAARAAGLNLLFMSGNEVYWKTRWEPSIDGSATPYRTLVCYKETRHHAPLDPLNTNPTWTWTGTWRDPRFSPPADGGKPENNLTGTIFQVDAYRSDAIQVPYAMSRFRFWRNTPNVSTLTPGSTWTSTPNLLGYEWDIAPDNGFAPASLITLSSATLNVNQFLLDYGSKTGNGTATHNLTLYRHPGSGALVFGAGTVFWAWGLSAEHDGPVTPTDPDVQQATVNLLAEMGVQPGSLQPGLIAGVKSTDTTPPSSAILTPGTGASFSEGQPVTITGTASDSGGQVAGVEVSVDGGTTWLRASGTTHWSYTWTATAGPHTIRSRATDDSLNTEAPQAGDSIVVAASASLFESTVVPESETQIDWSEVELGVRFSASTSGTITGIRFWKDFINIGSHTAHLWTSGGTLLASATFANETASGWQVVLFSQPVPITPGITYVASYHSNQDYSASSGFFVAPHTNGPLTASRGAYAYGPDGVFPNQTYQFENYWVDVLFVTAPAPTLQSITVTPANPTILTGAQQPFTATGTYSDGSTQNLTSQVTWTSSSPSVATINAAGLATGDSAGSSSISAALSGRTGSTGLTVQAAPLTVATTALPSGMVGTVYLQTLSATGGSLPYTWSISTGTLPSGLTLSAAGQITGTLTTAGTSEFTVQVQDASGATTTKTLSIRVANTALTIWPSTATPLLADAGPDNAVELGVKFRSDVNGTITGIRFFKGAGNTGTHIGNLWTSSGTLLASATFSGETASGWQQVDFATPVAITANTVYVASYHTNVGHYSADQTFFTSSGVDNPPLRALANGVSGGNGVYAYGSTSVFPTSAFNGSNYWVDVVLNTGSLALTITSSSLPTGLVDSTYSATLVADGGASPYNWSIASGTLPNGLTLSAAGQITGTLTTAGTSEFTVQVQDASGATTTKTLSIRVANTALTIWPSTATPLLADAGPDNAVELGVKFRSDVNGTITGIRFFKGAGNTGTHIGNLWTSSGTLLASATFSGETASGWQQVDFATPVAITANTVYVASYHTNVGHYSADQTFFTSSGVDNPPLRALANGVSGGNGVYAYGSTSVFPTSAFNGSNYWVDVVLNTGSLALTITSSSLPTGLVDSTYSATLVADGGASPYNWSIASGTLPNGLTLSAAGQITGTLTTAGTSEFTVQVQDASGATTTKTLSIRVANTALTIWPSTATPLLADAGPDNAVELGVKFRSDVNGTITGIRFFKGAGNTGTHIGNLWTSSGTLLASATFSGETASGWQQVDFATPVAITANTVYVASYHTNVGHYSADQTFFTSSGVDNPPLRALANGVSGGNGVYAYGSTSVFPTSAFNGSNYWVDVVLNTGPD